MGHRTGIQVYCGANKFDGKGPQKNVIACAYELIKAGSRSAPISNIYRFPNPNPPFDIHETERYTLTSSDRHLPLQRIGHYLLLTNLCNKYWKSLKDIGPRVLSKHPVSEKLEINTNYYFIIGYPADQYFR